MSATAVAAAATKPEDTFQVSLYLCTYNVATKDPIQDLHALLGLDEEDSCCKSDDQLPDLYAIGLQEVNAKPVAFLKDALFDDPWTNQLKIVLQKWNYVKIKQLRLQGLVLVLFSKRHHVTFIRNVHVNYTRTGMGGLWGNKGGVTIRFSIYGCAVCIINSHLAAHHHQVKSRIQDHEAILDGQTFKDISTQLIKDHDYIFWMGDLNFRIDELSLEDIKECVERQDFQTLWAHDQLLKCIKREDGFHWFSEGPLNFPPTYKFEPGTDVTDESRKPAWCDRILWLVNDDSDRVTSAATNMPSSLALRQKTYQSHPDYKVSDHKPVSSLFSFSVVADFGEELVKFHPIHKWKVKESATTTYTVRDYAPSTSTWDWIGLYKADFCSVTDYIAWVYSVPDGEKRGYNGCELTFPARSLTESGVFRLCYVRSKSDCIWGMSRTFMIEEESDTFAASGSSGSTKLEQEEDFEEAEEARDAVDEVEKLDSEESQEALRSEASFREAFAEEVKKSSEARPASATNTSELILPEDLPLPASPSSTPTSTGPDVTAAAQDSSKPSPIQNGGNSGQSYLSSEILS